MKTKLLPYKIIKKKLNMSEYFPFAGQTLIKLTIWLVVKFIRDTLRILQ